MKITTLNYVSVALMVIGIIDLIAMNFMSLDAVTMAYMRVALGLTMLAVGVCQSIENWLTKKSKAKEES